MTIDREPKVITETSSIPWGVLKGDIEGLSARVLSYAMETKDPNIYQNHRISLTPYGYNDNCLLIEAERKETAREVEQRIVREEQIQADHQRWIENREKRDRALYERLKEKYGDS